jgi:hypothetical protein
MYDPLKNTPWKVDGDGSCNIVDGTGYIFAHVNHAETARLMASAPELLEACERALAHLQILHPLTGDEDFRYLEDAIAKAKGTE